MEVVSSMCSPVGIALAVGFVIAIIVWLLTRNKRDTWERLGVPFVPPTPFLGSLWKNIEKPLHETEVERYKKYGRIYGYYEGAFKNLSVGDPKILRNIFVKDFSFFADRRGISTGDEIAESMLQTLRGEAWRRVRHIVTPTFTTGKIKRMMNIFTKCSEVLVQNFKTYAEKGEPVNTKRIFGAFSMDIIANAAFSTKIDSHNDPENIFVRKAKTVFNMNINWRYFVFLLFPRLMKFFKVPIFPQEGMLFFKDVTQKIIEERKRTGQKGNDFLQLLMDTADEQEQETDAKEDETLGNYVEETNEHVFKDIKPKRKSLSLTELVAQCIIFFLAGYETTASTLAFASYYLALNPHVQDRLAREVQDVIRACGGKLTYEAIQSMKYLDNVISETLRINPPATRLDRITSEDYESPDLEFVIPKDTVITIPVYAIHHDPEFYRDPETFDPDRFSSGDRVPYTFLPFGAGPRNCVGMRFALVEAKVCLAHVVANFILSRSTLTKELLEFGVGQGLLQPTEIIIKMELRKDNPLASS